MKHCILLLALVASLLMPKLVHAQAPNWQWAKQYGSTGTDWGGNITTDAMGNVYVVGVFSGSVGFGADTLISAGSVDIFIIKYNTAGHILWVKSYGGPGGEDARDIIVSGTGDIYVSGFYQGESPFGAPSGSSDKVFLAKFDNAGTLLWTRSDRGYGASYKFRSMTFDLSGNLLIGGGYYSNMILGNDTLMAHSNKTTPFVAKYDNNGNVLWAKSIYSASYSGILGLNTDKDERIYITGVYNDTIRFDSFRLLHGRIFLAKLSTNGNVIWAKNIIGNQECNGFGVAIDDDKNVFLSGEYNDTVKFDAIALTGVRSGNDDFLAKYDSSGNILWANKICHSEYGAQPNVIVDAGNDLYISGVFADSIKIGKTTTRLTRGGFAPYIIKLDNNGNELWGVTMTGKRTSFGFNFCLGKSNDMYMTGDIIDSIKCGSTWLKSNGGDNDIFVAKLSYAPNAVSNPVARTNEVTIYPQPSDGNIRIQFAQNGVKQVVVMDQLGSEVYSQTINPKITRYVMDLSHLPSGIYYAHFTGDHLSITRKILIQH